MAVKLKFQNLNYLGVSLAGRAAAGFATLGAALLSALANATLRIPNAASPFELFAIMPFCGGLRPPFATSMRATTRTIWSF